MISKSALVKFTVMLSRLSIVFALVYTRNVYAATIHSPDGHLAVNFDVKAGVPQYQVFKDGKPLLQSSRLGLMRNDANFEIDLQLIGQSKVELVKDNYEILTAKRRLNTYLANRATFHMQNAAGKKMDVIFQVSHDGVAFRYFFPDEDTSPHWLSDEVTSFHFMPGTRAWVQPMQVAKTGYGNSNPAYEEYYEQDIPVGTPSKLGAGWVFPALFRSGDTWLVLSEGSLPRNYCATHLRDLSPDGEYSVAFPDPRETRDNRPVNPSSKLPWLTPWRMIVVGSLKTVSESTLGIDLADPAKFESPVKPGKASWSWPLLGDGSANFDTQKEFIDYAARMGWSYTLIDAWWDKQIGYDKMKELADYAATKNVGILLWYNSAGDWNQVQQTPRDKLLTHESRMEEFARLKAMGIKGLKIDFFGGDGQPMIDYYLDLLQDASSFGLAMNFHGTTTPRGWERTYPNLVTMEAIRGMEFIAGSQAGADAEPTHAAMLPFTRNLFDPMDFTPMALDRINGRVQRRTTSTFELALSVLFVSGIQHYAEIPAGMAKAPSYVQEFLKSIPSVWDDSQYIDGFPGKFAVFARKGNGRWFVAGINAEDTPKKLSLDLSKLAGGNSGVLITDGDSGNLSFHEEQIPTVAHKPLEITLQPHGGFVLTLN